MMLQNYKTFCALKNVVVDPDVNIKTMITTAIEEAGFTGQRPAKMDIDDYLKLLASFNAQGLHFS